MFGLFMNVNREGENVSRVKLMFCFKAREKDVIRRQTISELLMSFATHTLRKASLR